DAVPVIPPELRPMVQLDGGRFATSDLNDLYRRVINRNNRLKRLLDLGAPEIIVNNEKRMLQEAVDALFDNGRRGRPVTGPGNRPLKSLSDMLKGKQGRFRQNLLGKRVDYSGRSVIVAGPKLKLHQCGLPKLMALELFKPFIMSRLVERKSVQNIKAAKKYVDSMVPEVWDVLEEVIAEHPVLLNRAPTLHRLGIQAFEPVLVEGKAIEIHPLVCHAFNADFDGDQMAVHLPLSAEAQAEARMLMLSANNILSPAHGKPLATPTQDMVLGGYYLTYAKPDLSSVSAEELDPRPSRFGSEEEVILALEAQQVRLHDPIEYRRNGEVVLTTPGRVIFNEEVSRALHDVVGEAYDASEQPYINRTLGKKEMGDFITDLVDRYGATTISVVLDKIKELGFDEATNAGITISKNDIVIPENKEEILEGYEERVQRIERDYQRGLITEDERHEAVVNVWTEATDTVADAMEATMDHLNPIYMMANSGARGSMKQIRQLAGMRGLMANPKGEIIERPIKANFMEGLSVLEYFISTHGARKGLADTALRTADSGYLTRRLVDVSQDVIVRDEDCGSDEFVELALLTTDGLNRSLAGRVLAEDVRKPLKGGAPGKTVLLEKGTVTTMPMLRDLAGELGDAAAAIRIPVRSVLKCKSDFGVCRACYGIFLATGELCEIGDAVGIIAAQSIGEPGTQLTMRTFHTGGVAGADITHGLPRVVEIFEARTPKGAAKLAEVGGRVEIEETDRGPKVTIHPDGVGEDGEPLDPTSFQLPRRTRLLVADGQVVEPGDALHEGSRTPADLLRLKGATPTELYLVDEVQNVYRSQGVDIHDKHIELIVRQMMKKVRVDTAGDTDLLPGQLVDRVQLERENQRVRSEKGEEATHEPLILGITKASLATESFLSAASFQETTKVLTDAAIEGKVDRLLGLKENVIIGKLIPAATGLKRYRTIEISPSDPLPAAVYTRPETEA
ncbi:MAG TPA: DNA-directed RNA polymerase subunit beta', partial [Actinomycetota bacterium]|nr:DNA-directed RNA polymerase subunit beta' [Actinomycetota bacterium]